MLQQARHGIGDRFKGINEKQKPDKGDERTDHPAGNIETHCHQHARKKDNRGRYRSADPFG